jgi:hypothetical protein
MLNQKTDTDATVGAEVTGHGDELVRDPLFFEELFSEQGSVDRLKEHHAI